MNYICESCGSYLKYYDKVSRMVRTKNRKASIITVKRFKCPVCNCIHRNLPNNIFPYKQYDARIITGVIEGKITSDMIDYEDYPCEMTMTKDKNLVLIEADNEASKPDKGKDVMQDNSEQEQLRSDVEFLSMMTGVDLGGD